MAENTSLSKTFNNPPTPGRLMSAVKSKNVAAVRSLLEHGANPNETDISGIPALMTALEIGFSCSEIAQLLINKGADITVTVTKSENSALMKCELRDDVSTAKLLIEKGANLDYQNKAGYTALTWAISHGEDAREFTNLLIESGADISIKNDSGLTALHWAASRGHIETIRLLLEKGASLEDADNRGNTPLIHAAQHKRLEAIQLLIDRGADIDARDRNGKTAQELAEEKCTLEVVALFKAERSKRSHNNTATSQERLRASKPPVTVRARAHAIS